MFEDRKRFDALLVGLVVVVALGVGAFWLLPLLPPAQTGDIAVPADDATPEQVVATYLDALNAHDCDTAAALATSDAEDSARSWCDDVASLTDVEVDDHFTERPRDSGHSRAEGEFVDVPVMFTLDWRRFHDDGSMDEGATTWGYALVRESPDSPWRIFDQGTG